MSHPVLTDSEIATLLPRLRGAAHAVGKHFPKWRLDDEDLTQGGWLSILSLRPRAGEPRDAFRNRCVNRAYVRMIMMLRTFQSAQPGKKRKMEALLDVERLAESTQAAEYHEDWTLHAIDLKRFVARLTPQEQLVFWGRYQAFYLWEIAEQLRRTESRACQIEKRIVEKLQEAA